MERSTIPTIHLDLVLGVCMDTTRKKSRKKLAHRYKLPYTCITIFYNILGDREMVDSDFDVFCAKQITELIIEIDECYEVSREGTIDCLEYQLYVWRKIREHCNSQDSLIDYKYCMDTIESYILAYTTLAKHDDMFSFKISTSIETLDTHWFDMRKTALCVIRRELREYRSQKISTYSSTDIHYWTDEL